VAGSQSDSGEPSDLGFTGNRDVGRVRAGVGALEMARLGLGLVLHGTIALAATLTTFSLSMLAPYASFVTGKDIDEILNR
jgi:hypothetical protein